MKKFLRALLPLCLLLICIAALSSCGDGTDGTTAPATTTAPVTTTIPEGPTGVEIAFNTLTLTGTSAYGSLPNATETFSFLPEVVVAEGATYKVALDEYGRDIFHAKTVPLEEGDNTFYIIVENGNDLAFYTITLRRRPIYTVVIDYADGTNPDTEQVEEGSTATIYPPSSRKGYQFLRWNMDTTAPITENTTFVAYWEILTYNITYVLNDGTNPTQNPATYTVKNAVTLANPTRAGYRFLGWKLDGETVTGIAPGTTGDKTFTAEWKEEYTISYELNGGTNSPNNPSTYTMGEAVTLAEPTRTGYKFLGWKQDGETATGIAAGTTGHKTFVADWEIAIYNITYVLNGGENAASNPSTYTVKDAVKLANPQAPAGYTFNGWLINGRRIDTIPSNFIGDLTIIAEWAPMFESYGNTITGLTSSGKSAIRSDGRLVIPDTMGGVAITAIDSYAFEYCTNLTSITIPNSVTSIGSNAFCGCTGLTSIVIPDGVTSIGSFAFSGCTGLTSITIPDSVTSIGSNAFSRCTGLTSITIPDSVTSIGSNAFSRCTGLTSITVPSSVTSIGSAAFYGCTGLESITLPFVGGSRTATDYARHFGYIFGCSSSYYNTGIYHIYDRGYYYTFDIPASLKTVIITGGGTSIGSSAFYGCIGLTSIVIRDSVTSIGSSAFYGCTGLTSIVIPDSVTSIGSFAFSGCTGLEYYIYDNAQYFGNDENPYFVLLSATSTAITSCTIHENTKIISGDAFSGCMGLTSVTFKEGGQCTSIGVGAFSLCTGLTSIVIPDSVTSIGDYAFEYCTGLTSIVIPDSVTSIGDYAFEYCTGLTSVTIPSSVTSIGRSAFDGCTGLTSVTFEAGSQCTSIGSSAFYGCTGLTSVTFEAGSQCTSIGSSAFYGCTGLTSIVIPDSVTSICDYAFYNCRSLTSIVIPDSVTSIGPRAFFSCAGLTSVTIGHSVTSIGSFAFSGCTGLMSVTFENTTGWRAGSMAIPLTALASPTAAATCLTGNYGSYVWTRE